MSFYRALIAAVAALGLATSVFAADESTTQTTTDTTAQAQSTDQAQAKVNINTATAKDLMKVKGLNASKAKSIVSYRKKHGDFKTLDDLKEVKGLKKLNDEAMKQVQDQLTLS